MKKIIPLILTILLLVSCTPQENVITPQDEYTLGVIYPQTGPVAIAGEFVRTGIELALEDINAQGGINGKPLKIITQDDACDPTKAISALTKLSEIDQVPAIIGPFCSSSAIGAAQTANQLRVVVLSPGAATPLLTDAGDYIFRTSPSDRYQAEFLAKEVSEKYDRIAVLNVNNQQAGDMTNSFIEVFSGQIVAHESFQETDADIRTQLTKIKASSPQALILLVFPAQVVQVNKQLKELGINLPLYATHTFETPESLKLGKDAERYIYSIQAYNQNLPQTKEFIRKHKEKYGQEPSVFSGFSYDATMLLAGALRVCGNDSDCVKSFLYQTQGYQGVSGIKSFDENGDIKNPIYTLKTVRNSMFIPLEE